MIWHDGRDLAGRSWKRATIRDCLLRKASPLTGKKASFIEKERSCERCNKKLSGYNQNKICHACIKRSYKFNFDV